MMRWLRQPIVLAWIILVALETLCQVSLKFAGDEVGEFALSSAALRAAVTSGWLWLAIVCYVGTFLSWMTILSKSALSKAFPTSAIVFVAVMVASWLVLGEALGWTKVLGSAIIIIGIVLMGSDRSTHEPPATR